MSTKNVNLQHECIDCGKEIILEGYCETCDPDSDVDECSVCGERYHAGNGTNDEFARMPSHYFCNGCERYRQRDSWTPRTWQDCPESDCPGQQRVWMHDDGEHTCVEPCSLEDQHDTFHDDAQSTLAD